MLKHYLTIALRTLSKQKLYTFVNLFGLTLGLTCVILILVYVQYERSFDRFHEQAERIHRIVQQQPGNVYLGSDRFAVTPAPLAGTLVSEFPEVTHATTIDTYSALLSRDDQHFYEEGLWADAHLFEVFTFPLLQGTPETALAEPNSLVLTTSLAQKIFGDEDPMGQTLLYQNQEAYTVTGVIEDVPDNAHFTFSYVASLISQNSYKRSLDNNRWNNNSWYTYFLLPQGYDYSELQAKMPAFTLKYLVDEDDDPEERNRYAVQPLTSIHLRSHINFEIAPNNDIKYIYLFSAIAVVILLLACINYMNLAVARSIKRAREVGMRKVVGAHQWQLIVQFIGESVLMSLLALALALLLAYLLLPAFGTLVERALHLDYAGDGWLLPGLLAIALVVGVVSGSYPAFFMSSLRPVHVLKGTPRHRTGRRGLPSLLVVGQYALSIILVAGSLVIYQQLRFIQNKELGYNREHVVTINIRDSALRQNRRVVKDELLRYPNVIGATVSSSLPTRISSSTTVHGWEGSTEDDELPIYQANVDYDFLDVFEIDLAEGRFFSRDFASDTAGAVVLNETAVKALGWEPGAAVGKQFKRWQDEGSVVGVVKDFHMHSFHQPIQPLMFTINADWASYFSVP